VQRIDKLLSTARRNASKGNEELIKAISRMTTDQLLELVNGDPSEDRLKEILASVGYLHLIESG
jgi:hypothetical protein